MLKFDHVCVVVQDITRSLEFYTQVLGARWVREHRDERMHLVLTETGGQGLELIQYLEGSSPRERGPVDHIAFRVENLEEALKPVRAYGASLLFPEPLQIGNIKLMFFLGPDRERIEYMEYLA